MLKLKWKNLSLNINEIDSNFFALQNEMFQAIKEDIVSREW